MSYTDNDFAKWTKIIYPNPCLNHINFSDSSSSGTDPISTGLVDGGTYRIKNVYSNLYIQVEGAKEKNGTNVQQWNTSGDTVHDIWKLVDAGNGYYYLVSQIGDGKTYYLNVAGNSPNNMANIEIYESTGGDSQKFLITQNIDGSYIIKTKVSNDKSAVEIANAGKGSGDNVQQWLLNDHPNQNWIFESVNMNMELDSKNNKISKNPNNKEIVKTKVYKDDGCVHTVVFVK